MKDSKKILLMGYGNPGRRDDGLGPLFADEIEKLKIPNVTVDTDYQLTVEDAHTIAQFDVVVFADAEATCEEPFYFREIGSCRDARSGVSTAAPHPSFSTHSVTPPEVLALARQLFSSNVKAYVLGIRGYEFEEFGEGLTERAQGNMAQALKYLASKLPELT